MSDDVIEQIEAALRELASVEHPDDPHDPICRAEGFLRAALTPSDETAEGCACTWSSEDRGGGYFESVMEPEPDCPTHYPSSQRVGVVQVGRNAVRDTWEFVEFARLIAPPTDGDEVDADVAERIAQAIEAAGTAIETAQREVHRGYLPIIESGIVAGYSQAARIARSHATPAEVEYGALRKLDGWSTAMPGASLEWARAHVPTDSILTLVQRRPGIAPGPWVEVTPTPPAAATEVVSGYTSHGHRITGVFQTGRPTSVARCGGPGLCGVCSREAVAAISEGDGR